MIKSDTEYLETTHKFLEDPTFVPPKDYSYDPQRIFKAASSVSAPNEYTRLIHLELQIVAAIELGKHDVAKKHIDKLKARFGETSSRVRLLMGLALEAKDQYIEAITLYQSILESDETNVRAYKRMIASYLHSGERSEAVKQLNIYLDTFMQDQEAWMQLAHLYLKENMLAQAAFCVEELMMLNPNFPTYHLFFADIKYTMKDYDLALKHYCRALEIYEDAKSLYGIQLCTSKMDLSSPKIKALNELSIKLLKEKYASSKNKASTKYL